MLARPAALDTDRAASQFRVITTAEKHPHGRNPRWTHRPEGSTWGDFGPDDQLGRLNLVTPEKVLQGIAEVKIGNTFCLSLPLHAHCLFKLGCYLGEMWYHTELADWLRANGRNRFLLTAPPLRLPGAVGSPATPVATV